MAAPLPNIVATVTISDLLQRWLPKVRQTKRVPVAAGPRHRRFLQM
jgi:hypothetical protein